MKTLIPSLRAPVNTVLLAMFLLFASAGCSLMPDTLGGPECIYVERSSAMLRLSLPVVEFSGDSPRFRDSPKQFAFQRCNARHVRAFVRQNESPVIVVKTNSTAMSVEGDICRPVPKFVFYDGSSKQLEYIYGFGDSPPVMMARRVAGALAVTKERCGTLPNEMQFVGREVVRLAPEIQARAASGKLDVVPFEYTDFYSGRMFPYKNTALVSDDPAQEAAHWNKRDRLARDRERKEKEREEKWPLGVFLGLMGFGMNMCEKDGKEYLCMLGSPK